MFGLSVGETKNQVFSLNHQLDETELSTEERYHRRYVVKILIQERFFLQVISFLYEFYERAYGLT